MNVLRVVSPSERSSPFVIPSERSESKIARLRDGGCFGAAPFTRYEVLVRGSTCTEYAGTGAPRMSPRYAGIPGSTGTDVLGTRTLYDVTGGCSRAWASVVQPLRAHAREPDCGLRVRQAVRVTGGRGVRVVDQSEDSDPLN